MNPSHYGAFDSFGNSQTIPVNSENERENHEKLVSFDAKNDTCKRSAGKTKWLVLGFLIASFIVPILSVAPVEAVSSEEIFEKILVNNFEYCYKNALVPEILLKNYVDFNSLMNDGYKNAGNTQNFIRVPNLKDRYNQLTAIAPNDKGRITSCYALLYKDAFGSGLNGEMSGLLEINGIDVPKYNDPSAANNFMTETLKYNIDTAQTTKFDYCYTAYVEKNTTINNLVKVGTYCRNEDNFPIDPTDKITFTGGDENAKYTVTGEVVLPIGYSGTSDTLFKIKVTSETDSCYEGEHSYTLGKCYAIVEYPLSKPTEGIKIAPNSFFSFWANRPARIFVNVEKKSSTGDDSKETLFKKDNAKWKEALKVITKEKYTEGVPFSDLDKHELYSQYLKTYFKAKDEPISTSVCQADKPSLLADTTSHKYYIYVKDSGWCVANLSSTLVADSYASDLYTMTIFTKEEKYKLNKVITTVGELINAMGELNYDEIGSLVDVDNAGSGVVPGSTNVDSDKPGEVTCANSGGAASLGWIVCPILTWMSDASKDLYDYYIKPALTVEPALFKEDGNNNIKDAWRVFQNFANVMFVILFLVVIFSQLTGIGLDNYGIKKVLPKLIVAAILVNLSYYICVIMIDLSNIIGNAVQSIFDGMANGLDISNKIKESNLVPNSSSLSSEIGTTAVTAIPLLAALVTGGAMVWRNPAILLTLLVAALGVAISIFFLFVILSAREAAVVVLTVVSPLAFVCYMLPNTKNLFDKWRKMGQGLLMVYPICGLLIGGGNYVSKLLLLAGAGPGDSNSGFFGVFTAMLIGVVPIFFIPTVLKSSFTMMGNIGAKISSFGDKIRGGAAKGMRGSEIYKTAQERSLERRARIRAGVKADGTIKDVKKMSVLDKLSRGGERGIARSRAQYLRDQDTKRRQDSLTGVGFDAAIVGQTKKAERDELMDYMTLINDRTRNGEDEETLFRFYDEYLEKENKAGAIAIARIAGRRKDTASRFLGEKVTGIGLKNAAGGIDVNKVRNLVNNNTRRSDIFRSVAKEISTGENSRNYMESTPFGFEFAAQHNRGSGVTADYSSWLNQNMDGSPGNENIHLAFENYITGSKELVGMKNTALRELISYRDRMPEKDRIRLQNLASETIDNRSATGIWDTTKAEHIYTLAGREAEYETTFGATQDGGLKIEH